MLIVRCEKMGSGWTHPDFPGCSNQPTSDSCAHALKRLQFQAMCSSSLPTVKRLAISTGALAASASGYSPPISTLSLPSAIQSNFRYDVNRPESDVGRMLSIRLPWPNIGRRRCVMRDALLSTAVPANAVCVGPYVEVQRAFRLEPGGRPVTRLNARLNAACDV